MDQIERFWVKVDRSGGPDACWLWKGWVNDHGYGERKSGPRGQQKREYAHRLSFEINVGPIPAGMLVCHTCDVRHCCNPAHLFLGTNDDNMADMVAKGRAARGTRKPNARLTPELVAAIRADSRPQRLIAAELGVDQSTISRARRETWAWVPS